MKPDPQAAPMQAWRLLANAGRTLTRTPSVWSVVLLVGLLALAQGRDRRCGRSRARARALDVAGAAGGVHARGRWPHRRDARPERDAKRADHRRDTWPSGRRHNPAHFTGS